MPIIICPCGSWLKAPEPDDPGSGRCPSCGRLIGPDGTISGGPDPDAVKRRPSLFRPGGRRRSKAPIRGRSLGFWEAVTYPLRDGPGLALLAVFPPFLTIMSVPVFDIVPFVRSGPTGGFNPLAILLLPFATPLILSFTLTFGYVLLYASRVLTDGAMGRRDHPRYPVWDWQTILEGAVRWAWAAVMGLAVVGPPIVLYVKLRGEFLPADWLVVAVLVALSAGYVQMGLAAAILHDSVAQVNPLTITEGIARIGRDYVVPWLTTAAALLLAVGAAYLVLFRAPSLTAAALGLYAAWIFWLYEAMVVMHVLGWTCYRHGAGLGWFRHAPKWGSWERPGRIYSKS